jgi:hypothetical protein
MKQSETLHLTAVITTIRHGEKDSEGNLTSHGHLQGAKRGAKTHHLGGDIILLHSGVGRVRNTLISLANHIHLTDPDSIKSLSDISSNYQEYTSHYLQYLYDQNQKGILFGTWDDLVDLNLEDERINKFLGLKDKSTEPDIYPSPKQMALRLAKVILTQIEFATITIPETKTNFINGTHEPVIASFLYYFLQNFNPQNSDFIKEIGGTVEFSDGFDIYIYQNLQGNHKIVFKFRDLEKEIELSELKKFCDSERI